jgi:hypothetical protein
MPPAHIGTFEPGKRASGTAINRAGTLELVADRADDTVSLLSIDGKNVKSVGTVSVATQPTPTVAAPPPALPWRNPEPSIPVAETSAKRRHRHAAACMLRRH